MGSTGEADRKRRHFSTLSPTAASAKKHPLIPLSEEKKLDAAVLQFQNQKLTQKLETQKIEINATADRVRQLKDKQQLHDKILTVVKNSWEELVDDLGSRSNLRIDTVKNWRGFDCQTVKNDGDSPPEDAILSRLTETGATESSSSDTTKNLVEEHRQIDGENETKTKNIMCNIVASVHDLNDLKNMLSASSLKATSTNEQSQRVVSSDLWTGVKNLRLAVAELHLEHRSVGGELQSCRDIDAKSKADLKRLKGELESTLAELEESNCSLVILKIEREMIKGECSPLTTRGNKQVTSDTGRDKQKDSQDMESTLKELMDQSTCQLHELKRLHEDKLNILRQLPTLQNNRKNMKSICSSQAFISLKDQLAKAKTDVVQYQDLYKKLQVEKESLFLREKEGHMNNELVDVLHRSSAVADSRIGDLETEIQRFTNEKDVVEDKLQEESKQPGRKQIIAEFKEMVTVFPEKMGSMQNQLAKYKVTAENIHCLRANVQSLTNILDHKVKESETMASRSAQQKTEIQNMQAVVSDLEVTDVDLKLFLDMYLRESTDSRDVSETRNSEMKAWAHVQSLNFSLDEHNLELRVKVAIEAEAKSQQRLATTEAEIADLRLKLEASKREKPRLSDVLKSKNEETEAYLSELETIGQAYEDMQTQNQQLLQQITERDDYNTKLVLEGVGARQAGDVLLMEKRMSEKAVQQTKTAVNFYELKAGRIEDQLKAHKDHIHRLSEDRFHNTATGENIERRLLDVRKSSQQLAGKLEEAQSKVDTSRSCHTELQIKLEKERFERKRVEEDLESLRMKAQQLNAQAEGSSIAGKLKQELIEYKEILKCNVCLDRRKEVVITKCYHLFCNPCVQKIIETTRHRKCPVCAASFGTNDVKLVYI